MRFRDEELRYVDVHALTLTQMGAAQSTPESHFGGSARRMPFILCFTILASVCLGVYAAYGAVFGTLFTFDRPAQSEPARRRLGG
jgi:hypothetical protein